MKEFSKFFILFLSISIIIQIVWTINNSNLILSIILSFILLIIILKLFTKIKLTKIKTLYTAAFLVIILILFFNSFKIFDMITLLNKEQKIITNLEENINNVSTVEELKILLEENFSQEVPEEIKISKSYLIDNKSYRKSHNLTITLFKSCISYIDSNSTADFGYIKQNYDTYYITLKTTHDFFGRNILINLIICVILDISFFIITIKSIKIKNS